MSDKTTDIYYKEIEADGRQLLEDNARRMTAVVNKTAASYDSKPADMTDRQWLIAEFKHELPDKTDEECTKYADEILQGIDNFDDSFKSINEYCDNDGAKEKWLADKLADSCTGMEINKFGEYLSNIDEILRQNNQAMYDTITTSAGTINQGNNLHGFIAEQYHVNSFNREAALKNSDLRAYVLKPDGHGYAKNSVDIVIKDGNNKIVERYQAKYYKDFKASAKAILHGDYRNQRVLVPKGQAQGAAELLPNKSVSDKIGGNLKTKDVQSTPLSKKEALKLEKSAQEKGAVPVDTWNSYNTKELAVNIGKQAAFAGAGAAALTVGMDVVIKAVQGEKIKPSQVMKTAITTGADTGAKTAMAAALKIAAEKGITTMLPRAMSSFSVTAIACIAVENVKVMYKVATGQMSITKGLDTMGRVTCSTIGGLAVGAEGGLLGLAAGAALISNPVGIAVCGVASMVAAGMAGAKVAEVAYSGVKKIAGGAVHLVASTGKALYSGAKTAVKAVGSGIKSVGHAISRGFHAITSWF